MTVVFRVEEQGELTVQLVGGMGDVILVLESLTDLLGVNQCVAIALVGEVTGDAPALVPVEGVWQLPWSRAVDVKDGIPAAVHREAKRLAKRG